MTHLHWPDDEPTAVLAYRCVEVSEHVCLESFGDGTGSPVGYFFRHDVDGATDRCTGTVYVRALPDRERPIWGSTGSLEDRTLTLTPSIRCVTHDGQPNAHGFVQAGRWVPA